MARGGDNNLASGSDRATIAADRGGVAQALAAAARFADGAVLSAEARRRLLVVVEELVVNVVVHGGAAGSAIEISLSRAAEGVRLGVADRGRPFDPRTDRPPVSGESALDAGREGGAGWPLILAWCRIESYTRSDGENYLELLMPT